MARLRVAVIGVGHLGKEHARILAGLPEAELVGVGWPTEDLRQGEWPTLHRAIGCPSCGRTGYRGRFAIHEAMVVSEEIERLIIERRSTEDIQKTAVMQGMLTLREDGLRKAAMGQTSLEEIFRVVA